LLNKRRINLTYLTIQAIEHTNISVKLLNEICQLKQNSWPYPISEQKKYIRKIAKKKDLHICLSNKSSLIGYTFLQKKKINIKLEKFVLLDTIIIKNKFQGKGFSKLLMNFNNFIILRKMKSNGMLVCKKSYLYFYKKFGWEIVKENKIKNFFDLKKDIYLMKLKA
jgi:predicted GNAT family N-acyltransferase